METKNFALIGAAGFVAPRHMKAIRDTGNRLVAALDKHDSVGIIDSYFPESAFFTEFERFDRHIDKLRRAASRDRVDFVSVCSPNYLHDAHVRFGLRSGADVVCEKPLVLNPWNIDGLKEMEAASGRRINNILQLRLHPSIIDLKQKVATSQRTGKYEVDLIYMTSRGLWYHHSWKGNQEKSGGIATNIGVHFFDMLQWVFGSVQDQRLYISSPHKAAGFLEYENARVRWFLSLDADDLPKQCLSSGQRTYRSIRLDQSELEFSDGFTDLHTASYAEILRGNGFGIEESRAAIETVLQYGMRRRRDWWGIIHRY